MGRLTVSWTRRSRRDLQEIYDFIAKNSLSGAQRVISRILEREQQLATHPNLGRVEEMLSHLGVEYRFLVQGNYKIIYRYDNTNGLRHPRI